MTGHLDAEARHRVRTDLDATLFVEAGAGTGKTTELVGRVVHLVATGRLGSMAELAAITFTEKAASELRDRIRRGLETAAGEPARSDDERRRCATAVDTIDDAAVGTLHGFAQRILAEQPIEAGLPPGFEVVDAVEAAVAFRHGWEQLVDALYADPDLEPILLEGFTLGLRLDALREVAEVFDEHWDRLGRHLDEAGPPGGEAFEHFDVAGAVDVLEDCVLAAAEVGDPADRLVEAVLVGLPPYIDALRAATGHDGRDAIRLLQGGVPWPSLNLGAKSGPAVELRDTLKEAMAHLDELLALARRRVLVALLARVEAAVLDAADRRRRTGRLTFADLLVLAARLLERDPEARRRLHRRHRVVLVDEFQDTDPLQVRLVTAIARTEDDPPSTGTGPDVVGWAEATLAEGQLFFVGDPKQSIYRFRRADIALYQQVRRRFADGVVALSTNHRTVPSILDWVNHVFTQVMGEGVDEAQPRYDALLPWRPALADGHPPAVLVLGGPWEQGRAAEIRRHEADDVADELRRLVDGGTEVVDPRTGRRRPARFGDVAVLIPVRTALAETERALDRLDVPYRIESRSLVFASEEVQDLVNLLRAVDDPGDQVALVAALRSPALACSDRDLARFRLGGGHWNLLAEPPAEQEGSPVAEALAGLRRLHEQVRGRPASEVVATLVRRLGLAQLAFAHRRPRDHWRRLRLVQDEARAFVAAGGTAVGAFADWLEEQGAEGAGRVETVVPEADDDAVRILTIHAAKGLEYPVVALTGLNIVPPPRAERVLWDGDRYEVGIGPRAFAFRTAGYQERWEHERQMDDYERRRLLYVATTRARDHLIVSLHHKARTRCHAAVLWEATGVPTGGDPWRHDWGRAPSPDAAEEPGVEGGPPAPVPSDGEGPPTPDVGGGGAVAGPASSRGPNGAPTRPALRLVGGTDAGIGVGHAPSSDGQEGRGGAASSGGTEPADDGVAALAEPDPAAVEDVRSRWETWRTARDELLAVACRRSAWTPSALSELLDPDTDVAHPVLSSTVVAGDPPSTREPEVGRGPTGWVGGADVGRAVHATLEGIDLADPRDLEVVAARAADTEGVDPVTVTALARSLVGSPVIREAAASGRARHEVPVAAPLGPGGVLVEGIIDLLFETPDGELVIVDHKTDQALTDEALDAALAHHRPQGAAYAAVVEAALGRPVGRVVFVFARPGGAVERPIEDLPAAIAEVLAALAGV